MKSHATMCDLARMMAIRNGPSRMGPVFGYSVSKIEIKVLYARNGFQNIDAVVTAHINRWRDGKLAREIRGRVFFYLNRSLIDDDDAYWKLLDYVKEEHLTEDECEIFGFMEELA